MSDSNRLNPPAVMFARLVFVVHLIAAMAGLVAIMDGVICANLRACAWGATALLVAFLFRMLLKQKLQLDSCEHSLDVLMNSDEGPLVFDTPAEAEFAALLERRDELERQRGTAAFDPWEILELRHRIDDCLRQHPELAPLLKFHDSR